MRRLARAAGLVLAVAGALTLIWAVLVWQWRDPFTSLYTTWQQHRLEGQLNREFSEYADLNDKHVSSAVTEAIVTWLNKTLSTAR